MTSVNGEYDIRIVHYPTDSAPYCIVWKSSGLPSAPLTESELCALTLAVHQVPILDAVAGSSSVTGRKSIERGLIHRLDNDTSGLLLIAATQEAYIALTAAQKSGTFSKTYRAEVDIIEDNARHLSGFPDAPYYVATYDRYPLPPVCSRFRPYGMGRKEVRPVTDASGVSAQKTATKREYTTVIERTNARDGKEIIATITAGFRHQVRCHLAWLGVPVKGDNLYNSSVRFAPTNAVHSILQPLRFECVALTFPHPLTGSRVTVSIR